MTTRAAASTLSSCLRAPCGTRRDPSCILVMRVVMSMQGLLVRLRRSLTLQAGFPSPSPRVLALRLCAELPRGTQEFPVLRYTCHVSLEQFSLLVALCSSLHLQCSMPPPVSWQDSLSCLPYVEEHRCAVPLLMSKCLPRCCPRTQVCQRIRLIQTWCVSLKKGVTQT